MVNDIDISKLTDHLLHIRDTMVETEKKYENLVQNVHPNYKYSALNFIRYLHLRTFKLRKYQEKLSNLGMSSIGHSERYTLSNLENILYLLHFIQGKTFSGLYEFGSHPVNFFKSKEVLEKNSRRLFGKNHHLYNTSIMVTLPTEASIDFALVRELIRAGMNNARINCGHDNPQVWEQMIHNVKKASSELGLSCQIYMDLAGPKLRTGPIAKIKTKNKKKVRDYILLNTGDYLRIFKGQIEGKNPKSGKKGKGSKPSRMSMTIDSVHDDIRIGERILFDDGKISGIIEEIHKKYFLVRIVRAGAKGAKLRAEKGINFPDSTLSLPSLTEEDVQNLPFIVQHADIVGYSFVRNSTDVAQLQEHLEKLNRPNIGLVLKIETRDAFNNFPSILITAMKNPSIGVMIARGDLAVELGPERISEVQEQLLWLCEAALIPNIWATQVLETLAKSGIATRAEITDAAMSSRAECVMLNKGEYILQAVQTLGNILQRMKAHQHKKKETLRALKVANRFFEENRPELEMEDN